MIHTGLVDLSSHGLNTYLLKTLLFASLKTVQSRQPDIFPGPASQLYHFESMLLKQPIGFP